MLHSRGSFEVFRRASSAQRWLYTHRDGKRTRYYGEEASRTRLQFFDHALKGEDNGWAERPPVRLAVHEAGPTPAAVTDETAWPPPDLRWTTLRLDATTRTLTEAVPAAGSASLRTRRDAVTFYWTVPEDLDVIGPMAARLYVELPDGGDVTLFVGVRKLRDGVEQTFEGSFGFAYDMVTNGWQRAAHRELDPELSTPWQRVHTHRVAEPLRPGEIVPVDVALRPQATRFRAGDGCGWRSGGGGSIRGILCGAVAYGVPVGAGRLRCGSFGPETSQSLARWSSDSED